MTITAHDYHIDGIRIMPYSHFTSKEMHCRCGCGMRVTPQLIIMIEALRHLCGFPLIVTSGARCATHNKSVGGYPKSKHLKGIAVDIAIEDADQSKVIAENAAKLRFRGIGIADTFIHLDLRNKPAQWTYA